MLFRSICKNIEDLDIPDYPGYICFLGENYKGINNYLVDNKILKDFVDESILGPKKYKVVLELIDYLRGVKKTEWPWTERVETRLKSIKDTRKWKTQKK